MHILGEYKRESSPGILIVWVAEVAAGFRGGSSSASPRWAVRRRPGGPRAFGARWCQDTRQEVPYRERLDSGGVGICKGVLMCMCVDIRREQFLNDI